MQDSIDLGISGLSDYQVLGRGGFATVYSARQAGFNRRVAVKVLDALDEAGLRRFAREQASMGSVHEHPNIVTPYSSGFSPSDGRPYLVMEHMAGGSLQQRLEREGRIPVAEAVRLILPIADALGHAHRMGVLHHDLKPANVLVSSAGAVKLSDFGIAAVLDSTATATVGYSLAYAPPETFDHQATADRRDERSDLYSLAATLFALIAGYAPFENRANPSLGGLMARILTQPVPVAGIPALDGFFATALAKDPAHRFQTAGQFSEALRGVEAAVTPVGPGASQGWQVPQVPQAPQVWQAPPVTQAPQVSQAPPVTQGPQVSQAPQVWQGSQAEPPGWYHASGDPLGTQRYWNGALWQGDPRSVPFAGPVDGPTAWTVAGGGPVSGSGFEGLEPAAGPARRLAARLIDFGILFFPAVFLFAGSAAPVLTAMIVLAAYEVVLASLWGTVGRKLLRVRVVGPSGGQLELKRSATRAVAMIGPCVLAGLILAIDATAGAALLLVYLLYLVLNIVVLFASRGRRVLWDRMAGTRVVGATGR